MATIIRRTGKNGQPSFRVQVRRKGYTTQTATFSKFSEAKKWAQVTEGAVLEGRHFQAPEAKRHTLSDLIDRYIADVLPHKSALSIRKQTQQLLWWKVQIGHCILADITPALIAEYRDKLAHGNDAPRANSTINLYPDFSDR